MNEKEKLIAQNQATLGLWKSGAKQKEDLTKFKVRLKEIKEGGKEPTDVNMLE